VPALSIVTATFNRAERLARLLRALDGQTTQDLEVVVVDDCSTDGTWQLLQDLTDTYPWLRTVQMPRNGGPARARNAGWQAATAPLVAFTDDDCVPSPDWAEQMMTQLADPEVDIVLGSTMPDPEEFWRRGPFDHSVRVERHSPMFETCNLALRRDLLVDLDGFDESFATAFGEDTDLGWRALERGARTRYVPEALVTHDVIARTFRGQLRGERRRTSLVTVVKLHPGLRNHLWRNVFYDPTHARLLTSFALTVVLAAKPTSVVRWAAVVASVSYYGRLRFRWSITQGPAKKWPIWMTQLFVLDTVDMARLVKQSVHDKTLVI
jgi:GT2 family glycosyltransferase